MLVDYDQWSKRLTALRESYSRGQPFPHVVLDEFLDPTLLKSAVRHFPSPEEPSVQYSHYNERKKFAFKDWNRFSGSLLELLRELNSPRFVSFLSELTGIPGLIADPRLEGGGLHLVLPGGFLNIHADFTAHHFERGWRRRCNLILYLNEGWQDDWGGQLELWDSRMRRCERKLAPIFNRLVVFNTDESSYHGHPEPLRCPPGQARRSIALYYYTHDEAAQVPRSTDYRFRPQDSPAKKLLIRLDSKLVSLYSRGKRRFPQADTFVTRFLRIFSALRAKTREGHSPARAFRTRS